MYRHSHSLPPENGEYFPLTDQELRDLQPPLEMSGEKVTLRPLRLSDSQNYLDLINYDREHLSQYGDVTALKYASTDDVNRSIEQPENPFRLRFGIWNAESMVGSINLEPIRPGRAEIGYWVGKEHIRRGYALDAVKALARFAFTQLGYDELEAKIVQQNMASRSVVEKAGFSDSRTIKPRWLVNAAGVETLWIYAIYNLNKTDYGYS